MKKRCTTAAIIFFFAYGLSWSLRYAHFSPPELNRYGFGSDADVYWNLSGNLLSGRGYVSSPGVHPVIRGSNAPYLPNISTAPGYPSILWVLRRVWNSFTAAYVLQGLLYFSILLLFADWCPFFSPGLIACVAFWPGFLIYSQGINSDLSAAFFAMLLVWGLERSQSPHRWMKMIAASGAILGGVMLIMTRSNALFFAGPLILGYLVWRRPPMPNPRLLVSVLLCIAVAYSAWSYRNLKLSGSLFFSAYAGQVLYVHYPPHDPSLADASARDVYIRQRVAAGESWPSAERAMYVELTAQVRREVMAHPFHAVMRYANAFTGLFVDAYFRLPDLLWAKLYGLRLMDNRKVDLHALTPTGAGLYIVARIVDLGLRLSAGILFLMFPFMARGRTTNSAQLILWWSVLLFIAGTSLVANSGERLQLPVTVFMLAFSWRTLYFLGFVPQTPESLQGP